MPTVQEVLQSVSTVRETLRRKDFEPSRHAGGSGESVIFDYQAPQPIALRNGSRYKFVPVVRESFTTDGSGGNTETFTLSHDLVDSRVSDDVLAYIDGSETTPDNIDFANDSVDLTDSGSNSDVTIYYVSGAQASVKLKKVAPGGTTAETLFEYDSGLSNLRDPNRDPRRINLQQSEVQSVVPTDYRLQWTINGPFSAGRDESTDPEPVNNLISLPIRRAQVSEIQGLAQVVNRDMADRI